MYSFMFGEELSRGLAIFWSKMAVMLEAMDCLFSSFLGMFWEGKVMKLEEKLSLLKKFVN